MGLGEWLDYIDDDMLECFLTRFQFKYHDNQDKHSIFDDECKVLLMLVSCRPCYNDQTHSGNTNSCFYLEWSQ